jgi:hypothetical protein
MAHTHEFDCIVCGAHLDSQDELSRHNEERHAPKKAMDASAPAEPMGNEKRRSDADKLES